LRWRSLLDLRIAPHASRPLPKLDLEVLTALRIGVYQLGFLDRVPLHAAVHESVELVKQAKKSSAAGMVNAVLRKLAEGRESLRPDEDMQQLDPAAAYAHPEWLVKRWIAVFGKDTAESICRYDQQTPKTAVRLRSAADAEMLAKDGIELAPGNLLRDARVVVAGDVVGSELFRSGQIAIQDEGSQLVAALVGSGRRVLDCCAAPGGKTGALATAMPEAEIVAAELHPHRARLLRKMVPQENVQVITADARELVFGAEFDRVLVDVPCSGTGTLARNPEIKWTLKPEDVRELQRRQIELLRAAMKHVGPGGKLVYSTCSLEREENQEVVSAAMEGSRGFSIRPMIGELDALLRSGALVWKDAAGLTGGDFLRTIPGVHPVDGFFAAVLTRD